MRQQDQAFARSARSRTCHRDAWKLLPNLLYSRRSRNVPRGIDDDAVDRTLSDARGSKVTSASAGVYASLGDRVRLS